MAKKKGKKEREKKSEIDKLREAVGLDTQNDFPETPATLEELDKDEKGVAFSPAKASKVDTELFVKIDEHTEVANELINIKKDIKAIIETISLLSKAEKLKEDAITKMEDNLKKLNGKLQNVERRLMEPEGISVPEEGLIRKEKLTDLHSDLESLKSELSRLK